MKNVSIKILKIMLLLVIGICLFSIASKVSAMHIQGPTTLVKGKTYTFTAYDEEGNKVPCGWNVTGDVTSHGNGKVIAKRVGNGVITANAITSDERATLTVTVIDSGVDSSVDDDVISSDSIDGEVIGSLVGYVISIIKTIILEILPHILGLLMS